nr:hypothetical protein [Mesorhizobium carmichaelinearum]
MRDQLAADDAERLARWRSAVGMRCAPLPWHLEGTDPYVDLCRLCLCLLRGVGAVAVAGPIQRLAVLNHPGGDAGAISTPAVADEAVIAVPIHKRAVDRPRGRKKRVERFGRSPAAWVFEALDVVAALLALRRGYAVEVCALMSNRQMRAARSPPASSRTIWPVSGMKPKWSRFRNSH